MGYQQSGDTIVKQLQLSILYSVSENLESSLSTYDFTECVLYKRVFPGGQQLHDTLTRTRALPLACM